MTIFSLPDNAFSDMELQLLTPQNVSRSGYTGKRQVATNPWHGQWLLEGAIHRPIIGEANFRPWRSLLAKLEGQEHKFRMVVVESDQHSGSNNATVSSSSGPTNLVIANSPGLAEGCFLTVPLSGGDEQLVVLTAALASGTASATFKPPLRGTAATGQSVQTKRPWGVFALDDSNPGYSVGKGQVYTLTLAPAAEAW